MTADRAVVSVCVVRGNPSPGVGRDAPLVVGASGEVVVAAPTLDSIEIGIPTLSAAVVGIVD